MISLCVLPSGVVVLHQQTPLLLAFVAKKFKHSPVKFLPGADVAQLEDQVRNNRHAYFTCLNTPKKKKKRVATWEEMGLFAKKNWFWGWLRAGGAGRKALVERAWESAKGLAAPGTVRPEDFWQDGAEEKVRLPDDLFLAFLNALRALVDSPPLGAQEREPYLRDAMPPGYWQSRVQCAQRNVRGQEVLYYVLHKNQEKDFGSHALFLKKLLEKQQEGWQKEYDRTYFIPFRKIEDFLEQKSTEFTSMVLAFYESVLVGCILGTYEEADLVATTSTRPKNVCVTMAYIHRRVGMLFGTTEFYTIYQVSGTGGGIPASIAYLQSMLLNAEGLSSVQIRCKHRMLHPRMPVTRSMDKGPLAAVRDTLRDYAQALARENIGHVSQQPNKLLITFLPERLKSTARGKELIITTAKLLYSTFGRLYPRDIRAFRFTARFNKQKKKRSPLSFALKVQAR